MGSLHLKNRIVFPPMRSRKAAEDGYVSDALLQHYKDRAFGPGLVIVEHAYVMKGGRISNQLGISDDTFIDGLSKLVHVIHSKSTPVVLQINHVGSATSSEVIEQKPVAPSSIKHPRTIITELPKALSKEEIELIISAFADAAERARKAGFDGVEIHNAHGYLLSQFASPLMNKRNDEYGGTVENRIRLSVRVVKAVRQRVGRTYPLFCRFGAEDMLSGGLALSEGLEMARYLVRSGIDVMDVSAGMAGAIPLGSLGQGFLLPQAEAVKRTVEVPVIGVGGITSPEYANEIIRKGKVDLVAVGRALWEDPYWAVKALKKIARANG
jgi:2,4-dienoyl-CoA reductase-like NADH-dependent reductase (Old Yellow Enzyme family)